MLTGPIATEAAPAGLISSAIGIVVGAGEIFGGGAAPSIAGWVAQHSDLLIQRPDHAIVFAPRHGIVPGETELDVDEVPVSVTLDIAYVIRPSRGIAHGRISCGAGTEAMKATDGVAIE